MLPQILLLVFVVTSGEAGYSDEIVKTLMILLEQVFYKLNSSWSAIIVKALCGLVHCSSNCSSSTVIIIIIFTSTEEVMFYLPSACLSVCLSVHLSLSNFT